MLDGQADALYAEAEEPAACPPKRGARSPGASSAPSRAGRGAPRLRTDDELAGIVTEVGAGVDTLRQGDHAVVTLVRSCGRCFYCVRGEATQCQATFAIDQDGPIRRPGGEPIVQGLRVGGFAERVTVHSSQVVAIAPGVPLESACLLACAVATGVGAVRNGAQVPAGASVAVVGTGGVGLNSIQGAALAGANPVIAIDVSDSRLDAARRFGATQVVNSSEVDAREMLRSLTPGVGPTLRS